MNKNIRDKWDKWLLKLWGMIIHTRDKDICQWCRKQEGKMDAHHVFSRGGFGTRWDTKNGIILCYYCHHWRLKKDQEGLRIIVVCRIGVKEYEEMYRRFVTPVTYIDYENIEKKLLDEMETLKITVPKRPKLIP